MSVHGYLDETRRGDRYIVVVALVDSCEASRLRGKLRAMRMPGQRELHFKKESDRRRRTLADKIVALGIPVRIYAKTCNPDEEPARQDCMREVARDLVKLDAQRLVLDTRETRDRFDRQTFQVAFRGTDITFHHMDSASEALMWIADSIGWCYGAGSSWRLRITSTVDVVVDLDQP